LRISIFDFLIYQHNPDKPSRGGQAGNSKTQTSNNKQIAMTKIQNLKREYDLEERTFQFA